SRDARGINSGAPTRHAVEPHADRATCLAPRDLCHALPGELAHEVFVFRRIAQEHEAAGAAFEDLPGRRGIGRQRAKRLDAALRADSNHTFHGRHRLPAFAVEHSVSGHAARSAVMAHYAQAASLTAATILRAASSRSSAAMTASLDSWSSALPRATLVPSRRTTSGTPIFASLTAAMMPSAMMSQRMMPPKIFTSTPFTCGSERMILKASAILSFEAPPPTSRKFAGSPPRSLMMSIVAMARPAPLTMQPMVPSSFT